MQPGGFSWSFSAQLICSEQIFATMLTRAKTRCKEQRQNVSHIWFSTAKSIGLGLQRCWRPWQKCLQELGLQTRTVKAAVGHNGLANLQTSLQPRIKMPAWPVWRPRTAVKILCQKQSTLEIQPTKHRLGQHGRESSPGRAYHTSAWYLDLASNAQPFQSWKDKSKSISFTASLEAIQGHLSLQLRNPGNRVVSYLAWISSFQKTVQST